MEDRDFVDLLYQEYTKTTGAEDTYWQPEKDHCEDVDGNDLNLFIIYAVGKDQNKTEVASYVSEADADFITALHGCFPDLTRRLHSALDEADRLDERVDEQEGTIFDLAREIADLRIELGEAHYRIGELETTNEGLQQVIREMEYELEEVGR